VFYTIDFHTGFSLHSFVQTALKRGKKALTRPHIKRHYRLLVLVLKRCSLLTS